MWTKTYDFFYFLALLFISRETSKHMLMLHMFFFSAVREHHGVVRGSDWLWMKPDCFPCSYHLLKAYCRVSFSVLPLSFGQNISSHPLRLTFYLWWDGQLRAYQHGHPHFLPVLAMTEQRTQKQSSWKLKMILDESGYWMKSARFSFPKRVCVKSLCVCAVKSRAQLHGDVSSEVMAASFWWEVCCRGD